MEQTHIYYGYHQHYLSSHLKKKTNPPFFFPLLSLSLLVLRIEETSTDLRKQVVRLEEELDQERKKYTMLEIKLRNSERAREDAEKRNHLLQKEMEEFFSTLGCLTVGSQSAKGSK